MGVGVPDWMHKKMPGLQPFWVILERPGHPDKKRLMTVQDFFAYTEEEGESVFLRAITVLACGSKLELHPTEATSLVTSEFGL